MWTASHTLTLPTVLTLKDSEVTARMQGIIGGWPDMIIKYEWL